jgi:predicted AAA+ superfamily ATPase
MKKVSETLAGRAVLTTLSPMTRGEMMGLPRSGLWDAALEPVAAGELLAWVGGGIDLATAVPDSSLLAPANAPTRDVWIREAWRGGFPALLGQDDAAAAEWFDGFERTYLERDVMGLAGVSDIVPFRRAIRVAALQAGGILNVTDVARSVSLSAPTVSRYLDCIEVAMQGRRLPPLAASRRKRLIRSPKLYLADSGLHAHVCGLRDAGSLADSPLLGATMETWVLQQLDVAASRLKPAAEVGYWRTADGYEVDFVMERGDRLVGIEVKSGRGPSRADTRGLTMLREEVGDRFSLGVVLHGGTRAEILGERILALPAAYAGM